VSPGPSSLPAGLATFLSVDLGLRGWSEEASTDEAGEAQRRLAVIVSAVAARHGGAATVGASEAASFAFARAADGLACALDAQRELAAQRLRLLRMGLHSGEAQLGGGAGHLSPALASAARLRDLGHAGQVLVSQACADLVTGRLPPGASLSDLGLHRMRDLSRPEPVFQLCHPELPASFGPLRSLGRYRHNLAVELTSFVGREAAMAELGTLLGGHGLVSVVGSGGCGKTRLALHVAAEALGARASEAWFVGLSGLADPSLVPGAVMAAMGIQGAPGQSHTETLVADLAEKNALVLLDNCEHVLDGASALAEALVSACGRLAVLATSRQPLGVAGEVVWRVPSLSLPDVGSCAALEASEAARLFRDRARSARPGFGFSVDNAPAVAAICRCLDGIPLAIELAAARVAMMSPETLAEALADRFHLLSGGRPGAVPRQATLWASVDWSYGLLPEVERALLRRLSVFAGGFSLEAAQHVGATGERGRGEVLQLLSSLVDKSLVQVNDQGDRYRLLETIRAYAAGALAGSSEEATARDRHLSFYLGLGEGAETGLWSSATASWLGVLSAEHDNLRAALDWAMASGQADAGARLLCAIGPFLYLRSYSSEGLSRCHELLAHAVAPAWQAGLYWWASYFAWWSDAAACQSYGEDLIELGRQLGDDLAVARGLAKVAEGQSHSDPATALGTLAEGLAKARAVGDDIAIVECLNLSSGANNILGRWREALACAEEALAVAERTNNPLGVPCAMGWIPGPAMQLGQFERAGVVTEALAVLAAELGSDMVRQMANLCRGELGLYRCEPSAVQAMAEARRMAERNRNNEDLGDIRHWQGTLALALGQEEEGCRALEEAIPLVDVYRPICGARARCLLAEAAVRRGDLAEGRRRLEEVRAMPSYAPLVTRARARLARASGDHHLAWELATEGLGSARSSGECLRVIEFLELLALLCADEESYLESGRLLGAASAERRRIGYVRSLPDQADLDAAIAKAQVVLGAPGLASALSEGESASLDEAVAYLQRGRGRRDRPSIGWASLTPTERSVVELVAAGLSNEEIGGRMFVSTATVKTHLHHIFGKLGVANRRQLALAASDAGRLAKDPAPR